MTRKHNGLSRWAIILMVVLLIFSCQRGNQKKKTEKTLRQAIAWVYEHPANFNDGRFVEISEEIITFYILGRYTKKPTEKSNYLKQIKKRLDLIASNQNLKLEPGEYTMVLAVTEIAEKLGLKTPGLKKIIENQLLSDPGLYPNHITTCIWNTVYLKRLGYNPSKPLEDFLPQSTLSHEVNQKLLFQYTLGQSDPRYIDLIATTVYNLTHEIFALTDFGELPPPTIITENRLFFTDLFGQSIEWAIKAGHVDVLAEMIMCVKILNLEKGVNHGIDFIISRQEKDGSFGLTNPGRANNYRHGVLVSIMALAMQEGEQ